MHAIEECQDESNAKIHLGCVSPSGVPAIFRVITLLVVSAHFIGIYALKIQKIRFTS